MKLHKKHWGAVLLAGVVAVGVLAWGSYSRDTFSFEATNMNAWVEGVLSEEFHRLVERGAPLQLERVAVAIPVYAVHLGWRFPRHEVRPRG